MKTRIRWHDRASFVGETESGHAVVMDGPPDLGGGNLGPRPMEMLLLGLGGCTAFDVMMILQKARQPVADCEVEIEAERATEVPKVFTRINIHFKVYGQGVSEKQVERAIELSANKYCSASIMLGQSAEIIHDYEIIEDQTLKSPMQKKV
jgi:putative redox protein